MGEDLHAGERDGLESMVDYVDELASPRDNFDAIDEDLLVGGGGGGVNNSSIFYGDFPALPDFPCMSSSSSSSSTPAPLKGTTSMTSCSSTSSTSSSSASSYSAASWAVLKSDADEDHVDKKPSQLQHHHHHPQSEAAGAEAEAAALLSTASMGIIHQPSTTDGEGGILDGACMDVMETFGYMDLMENSDIWDDPSSIFESDQNPLDFQHQQHQLFQQLQSPSPSASSSQQIGEEQQEHTVMLQGGSTSTTAEDQCGGGGVQGETSEDLAMVFFEWLKSNKESISAEDLRKIRLKRSTIECAAKRLGGGKEGMKRLLKLILEWVQNHQLHQGKRMREEPEGSQFHNYQFHQDPFHNIPNPNPNPNLTNQNCTNSMVPPPPDQNPCFSPSPWNISHPPPPQPPPYMAHPAATAAMAAGPGFSSMVGYMGEPLVNGNPYPPTNEYHHHHHVLDTASTWPSSPYAMPSHYNPFPDNPIPPPPPQVFAGYGNPYTYQHFPGNGEKLVRLGSSATKEARQKRMARQRRFLSHHRHSHNHHSHQQDQQHNQIVADQHARLIGSDNCTSAASAQANPANWVYWPSAAAPISSSSPVLQPDAPVQSQPLDRPVAQLQNFQRQEKRQGWKPEKNLRFLLQKVLKQSDVGNLGRIVLPKKEAETHLPELDARDGISIPMEDIGTSRVWNMRYRFWPNNKSRMYLLENTGEFVRTNGLQEGDFIVIYSDVKCGKYMIRGVKVRQAGPKPETKKSGKGHKNHHHATTKAGNGASSSSPNKANNNDEMKKNEKKNKPTPFTDSSMKIDEHKCG